MQNVLPLTPGNPLRNITGLARQISLPGEHAPLRFPSFPALERTAVMGFNQPSTLTLPANTPVSVTVFRQAAFPVWADQKVPFWYNLEHSMEHIAKTTTPVTSPYPVNGSYEANKAYTSWSVQGRPTSQAADYSFTSISATGGNSLQWPIVGKGDNLAEFFYAPAGATVGVAWVASEAAVANYAVRMSIERWGSPGESGGTIDRVGVIGIGNRSAAALFTSEANQWLRITNVSFSAVETGTSFSFPSFLDVSIVVCMGTVTFLPSTTTAGAWTLTVTSSTAIHAPISTPTEFSNTTLPWYATRVTAAAMLGTNVSQVLNKGGTVLGGRVSPRVMSGFTCPQSYIAALHPAEKAFLPLETGVYTYAPPSTDLVFFADYTMNTISGAANAPVFRLDNDSMYNKIFLTAGAVDEVLAVTSTWHVEFRTSSALFQVGLSAMTLESLHSAQLVLAENGFFFENPEHHPILEGIIKTAKKYAPAVAGTANPMLGKIVQAALNSRPKVVHPPNGPSKPKTTTAAASGMNGQQKKQKKKTTKKGGKRKN